LKKIRKTHYLDEDLENRRFDDTKKMKKIDKIVKRNNFSYSENHFGGALNKYHGENLANMCHV
jgi:hypothetical protein